MKISCLAITENRAEFAEWMIWNYLKQDYPNKEFILVASTQDGKLIQLVKERIPGAKVATVEPGMWVPEKRNIAMSMAQGDFITWFDDDDWSSHRRLSYAVANFDHTNKIMIPHGTNLYFWHLKKWKARHLRCSAWAYGLFETKTALEVPFDEKQRRATDTKWMSCLKNHVKQGGLQEFSMTGHAMVVTHKKNISNPMWKAPPMSFQYDFDHVMDRLVLKKGEREVIEEHLIRIKKRQGVG